MATYALDHSANSDENLRDAQADDYRREHHHVLKLVGH